MSARDLAELAELQALADDYLRHVAPLPIAELTAYMKSQGIDTTAPDELAQAYAAHKYNLDAKCDREVYCAMAERMLSEANMWITKLEAQLFAREAQLEAVRSQFTAAAAGLDKAEAKLAAAKDVAEAYYVELQELEKLQAQLSSANARAETADRRAEDADYNSGQEIKEKMRLRAALEEIKQAVFRASEAAVGADSNISRLLNDLEIKVQDALNPRGEGEE